VCTHTAPVTIVPERVCDCCMTLLAPAMRVICCLSCNVLTALQHMFLHAVVQPPTPVQACPFGCVWGVE
jgi:hypothetical protein